MGCDIHSVVQVRKDGEWRTVEHRPGGDDRNYDTFAVYANVRNGFGFAGVSTGAEWPFISEPRGLPADFHVWEGQHHGTYMGDHSFSWLLLSEIQKAWEGFAAKDYEKHGVLSKEHYAETLALGKLPKEWCGGKSGRDVVVVDEEQVKAGTAGHYTDVQCKWKTPAQDRLYTMNKHLEVMKWLPDEYQVTADDVRLVFGFDS